ncbi:lipoprotein-releasing system ATP-binding protein LolD [Clostridium puniceum]|uniref:Lipoprotein-releasing system ATP-binding protein LolD n=1 Tax=Clostridium puniceum TaxID=29367 RepID=A0A1S8TW14_9CLOT|nr:ATP-binding cassette domain-containing protein [Clostridium puniceum]OOM81809.1 lipoprotein-releasing system ATP-binding protein LolD [Clostridium puniceum]
MLELLDINKSYGKKSILKNFSMKVSKNEFITITGKSGSGKTTLLNIIGLLENPDNGTVKIIEKTNPTKKEIQLLRRNNLGYIFQNYALLENETVKSNLLLAAKYNKNFKTEMLLDALDKVELNNNILNEKVYQLSGGEQQRIAIARILLKPCDIILADEPTGNLDEYNKKQIVSILCKMKNLNKTIVCVTHDSYISNISDNTIFL